MNFLRIYKVSVFLSLVLADGGSGVTPSLLRLSKSFTRLSLTWRPSDIPIRCFRLPSLPLSNKDVEDPVTFSLTTGSISAAACGRHAETSHTHEAIHIAVKKWNLEAAGKERRRTLWCCTETNELKKIKKKGGDHPKPLKPSLRKNLRVYTRHRVQSDSCRHVRPHLRLNSPRLPLFTYLAAYPPLIPHRHPPASRSDKKDSFKISFLKLRASVLCMWSTALLETEQCECV